MSAARRRLDPCGVVSAAGSCRTRCSKKTARSTTRPGGWWPSRGSWRSSRAGEEPASVAPGTQLEAGHERAGSEGRRCGAGDGAADHGLGALAEDHDRPTVGAGVTLELGVGVDRHRMPNRLEHRQVTGRVAVGVALVEIESLPPGEGGDRVDLALAVAERSVELAGVHAVDHLAPGADGARHAE